MTNKQERRRPPVLAIIPGCCGESGPDVLALTPGGSGDSRGSGVRLEGGHAGVALHAPHGTQLDSPSRETPHL